MLGPLVARSPIVKASFSSWLIEVGVAVKAPNADELDVLRSNDPSGPEIVIFQPEMSDAGRKSPKAPFVVIVPATVYPFCRLG